MESEEDREVLEPEDLVEVTDPDLPEVDLPEAEVLVLAEGEVPEPDLVLEPAEVLRLLLPVEEDFEPVFEVEEVGLLESLLLLRPCISPEDMEEAELPKPDWPEPDDALEPEPVPDIEDCPEFF